MPEAAAALAMVKAGHTLSRWSVDSTRDSLSAI
jgi:hypothetical protein